MVEQNITIGGKGLMLKLVPKHDEDIEPVDGSGVIVFDDPSLFTATEDTSDPSGLSFIITTSATTPVDVKGTASVDADLGPGVNTLTFEFTLHAVTPQANVLTGEFTEIV